MDYITSDGKVVGWAVRQGVIANQFSEDDLVLNGQKGGPPHVPFTSLIHSESLIEFSSGEILKHGLDMWVDHIDPYTGKELSKIGGRKPDHFDQLNPGETYEERESRIGKWKFPKMVKGHGSLVMGEVKNLEVMERIQKGELPGLSIGAKYKHQITPFSPIDRGRGSSLYLGKITIYEISLTKNPAQQGAGLCDVGLLQEDWVKDLFGLS